MDNLIWQDADLSVVDNFRNKSVVTASELVSLLVDLLKHDDESKVIIKANLNTLSKLQSNHLFYEIFELKSNISTQTFEANSNEIIHFQIAKFNQHYKRLKNKYSKLFTNLIDQKNLRTLIVELSQTKGVEQVKIVCNLDQIDYELVKNLILKSKDKDVDTIAINHDWQNYQNPLSLRNSIDLLTDSIAKLDNQHLEVTNKLELLRKQYQSKTALEFSEVRVALDELIILVSFYQLAYEEILPEPSRFFNFKNDNSQQISLYNQIRESYSKLLELATHKCFKNIDKNGKLTIEKINKVIYQIETILNQFPSPLLDLVEDYIKRITISEDSFTENCFDRIDDIIASINLSNVLKHKLEINSNNAVISLHSLHHIIVELKNVLEVLNILNSKNEWIEHFQNQPLSIQQQYKLLSGFQPNKRMEIFEANFNEALIHRYYHFDLNLDVNQIQISKKYQELLLLNSDQLKLAMVKRIQLQVDDLKKKKGVVSSLIGSKKNKPLSQEDYERYNPIQFDCIDNIENGSIKISYQNLFFDLEMEDQSFDDYSSQLMPIEQYHVTQRYGIANHLATEIINYNNAFIILQTKHKNIISFLPESINTKIIASLNTQGVKNFKPKNNEKELLIESILEESREKIILLWDGIFSVVNQDSFIHEIILANAMSKIGYRLINLNTHDFLAKEEVLKSMVDLLKA